MEDNRETDGGDFLIGLFIGGVFSLIIWAGIFTIVFHFYKF